ncbi:MAG TPA: ribonuclease D [Chloroflexi bacterium]|nr:ribonuclease D [Chloroflexota bacterium]HHW89200.1 ribonuclease D [Chloroflexota bacterium]
MSVNSKPTQALVYTPKVLHQLIAYLRCQPRFALDTESDSLYSYHGKVCLIQISVQDEHHTPEALEIVDFLVDPLRLDDLTPLGELLADPAVEVVMHAADNDMLMLYRSYGFTFGRVFDTQLAARILGWSQVGLAALLEKHFGIVSNKRMQRTDWGKRPLTPQQIAYAQMDTHYLLPLRDLLVSELQARGRWEEAQDAFAALVAADPAARTPEERTFWQMRAVRDVPRQQHGVLEALWQWREDAARAADRPPFKVVNDAVLIDLAKLQPETKAALEDVPGLSELQIRRYGDELLRTIQLGRLRPLPTLPNGEGRPEQQLDKPAQLRYDALRRWRTETARARGVDADIVLPNSTLFTIAQSHAASLEALAQLAGLTPWKLQHYGPAILDILAQTAALQPA